MSPLFVLNDSLWPWISWISWMKKGLWGLHLAIEREGHHFFSVFWYFLISPRKPWVVWCRTGNRFLEVTLIWGLYHWPVPCFRPLMCGPLAASMQSCWACWRGTRWRTEHQTSLPVAFKQRCLVEVCKSFGKGLMLQNVQWRIHRLCPVSRFHLGFVPF